MDGLLNVSGLRTIKIELAGKEYTLETSVLADYAEREQYILSRRKNPLELLLTLPALPPAPEMPVPPDGGAPEAERNEYSRKLKAYQQAKRQHDELVAQRRRLEDRAWKDAEKPQFVSMEDEQAFDTSIHGIAFRMWRAMRNHHPEIGSVQAALHFMERIGESQTAALVSALDKADERDLLKNSKAGPGEATSESPGGESSPNLPADTNGLPTPS